MIVLFLQIVLHLYEYQQMIQECTVYVFESLKSTDAVFDVIVKFLFCPPIALLTLNEPVTCKSFEVA